MFKHMLLGEPNRTSFASRGMQLDRALDYESRGHERAIFTQKAGPFCPQSFQQNI